MQPLSSCCDAVMLITARGGQTDFAVSAGQTWRCSDPKSGSEQHVPRVGGRREQEVAAADMEEQLAARRRVAAELQAQLQSRAETMAVRPLRD